MLDHRPDFFPSSMQWTCLLLRSLPASPGESRRPMPLFADHFKALPFLMDFTINSSSFLVQVDGFFGLQIAFFFPSLGPSVAMRGHEAGFLLRTLFRSAFFFSFSHERRPCFVPFSCMMRLSSFFLRGPHCCVNSPFLSLFSP